MPFDLSHDAPDAIGYYFKIDDKRFTLITDTGVVTPIMYKLALGSDILFLEANYCEEMLKHGSYPISVKNRISSNLGHLSNRAAINFLNDLYDDDCSIRQIFLCHLSKNNNSVEAVQRDFDEYYDGDIPYRICNRDEAVSYKEVIR
ncbi:MAG: hypothetical protein B6229_07770 [Spirochaetaceae bacterium 4572_7]|nr:MAG: hypothetical protein B6229_07770 [Spirochaetaceae bacterium 4572_7]